AGFFLLGLLLYVVRLTYAGEDLDTLSAYLQRTARVRADVAQLERRAGELTPEQVPDFLREVKPALDAVDDLKTEFYRWAETDRRGARETRTPLLAEVRELDSPLAPAKVMLGKTPPPAPQEIAHVLEQVGDALANVEKAGGTLGTLPVPEKEVALLS